MWRQLEIWHCSNEGYTYYIAKFAPSNLLAYQTTRCDLLRKIDQSKKLKCCGSTHGNNHDNGRLARRHCPLPVGMYPDLQRFCDRTCVGFAMFEETTTTAED